MKGGAYLLEHSTTLTQLDTGYPPFKDRIGPFNVDRYNAPLHEFSSKLLEYKRRASTNSQINQPTYSIYFLALE